MWGLTTYPAVERLDLLAEPTATAVRDWKHATPVEELRVAPIDPDLADTAACCAAYDIPMEVSANCVVVAGRRAGQTRLAACVILATTRADVNGVARRRLDARKASFADREEAVRQSGMEYGGITPVGLAVAEEAAGWPILVDEAVARTPYVVVGSGLRRSKLVMPGRTLLELPGAELVAGLGQAVD